MTEKTNKMITIFLVGITFILITATALIYSEDGFIIVPLYVSLAIMLLQSKANRYAFLLGGINSLLYAGVYAYTGLYAMAAYAALVSCPLQLVTFLNWSKRPYGNATVFKKLSLKNKVILFASFVVLWLLMWAFFSLFHSAYLLFDNTVTLLGIASTVLCALSFVDYAYLQIAGVGISIVLYSQMLHTKPIQITYLIYSVFALVSSVKALGKMNRLYIEQKTEESEAAA